MIIVGTVLSLTFEYELRAWLSLDGFFSGNGGSRTQRSVDTSAEESNALRAGQLGQHHGLQVGRHRPGARTAQKNVS